jgi:Rrf2 family iron-sulfur cluster assembly transcriptional regulator
VFTYSKLVQAGIAAVSYLAAVDSESRLAGSAEIAESREISRTLVAKILTILSRAGIVAGTPGPSGGYRLARPAGEISLLDVVRVFEDLDDRVMCPFGPNWCGHGRIARCTTNTWKCTRRCSRVWLRKISRSLKKPRVPDQSPRGPIEFRTWHQPPAQLTFKST